MHEIGLVPVRKKSGATLLFSSTIYLHLTNGYYCVQRPCPPCVLWRLGLVLTVVIGISCPQISSPAETGWCAERRRAIGLIARGFLGAYVVNCSADFCGVVVDTSCILAWLIEEGYEVYAFMADVGQEEV